MNNNQLFLSQIPSLDAQELNYLLAFTKDLPQDKLQTFIAIYNSRRKTRYYLNYLFTGFCWFCRGTPFFNESMGNGDTLFFNRRIVPHWYYCGYYQS